MLPAAKTEEQDLFITVNSNLTSLPPETFVSQMEKSIILIEEEVNSLLFKVEKSMTKLTSTNVELSNLSTASIDSCFETLDRAIVLFKQLIQRCDNLQDKFVNIEILAMKIQHFRSICEELAKLKVENAAKK
eukprot:TRINITY_DN1642_c0_g3_i1.p1 TRINITY_DN1642_c0_g3~~TRINITY_DN1642_c0_g3_i1.p1  ORF type:complete len:132 (-),score=27.05 TRINITY_DN1642_c0_g3_i1:127-522(-)